MLGARPASLAHGIASALFLVFLAGLLASGSFGWIALKARPLGPGPAAVLRSVAYRNASGIVLRPGSPWTSGPIEPGAHAGTLRLEVRPRLRHPARADTFPSRGAEARLELTWRAGGRTRTRRIPVADGSSVAETIEIGEGVDRRPLVLGLGVSGAGVEAVIERGGLVLLGVRSALLPALLKSLLIFACLASALAALTQWFSGFVGPVVAAAAALTAAFSAAAARAMAGDGGVFEAALLLEDPVSALRGGRAAGWGDVARAALLGAGAQAVAAAGALLARRPGEEA
jgi:hypothetical protein